MRSSSNTMRRPVAALMGLVGLMGVYSGTALADTIPLGADVQITGEIVQDSYKLPDGQTASFFALKPAKQMNITGDDPMNADVVAQIPNYTSEVALINVSSTSGALKLQSLVGQTVVASGKVWNMDNMRQAPHPQMDMRGVQLMTGRAVPGKAGWLGKSSTTRLASSTEPAGWAVAPAVSGWAVKPTP